MSSRTAIEALLAEIQELKQEQALFEDRAAEAAKTLVYDRDMARFERDTYLQWILDHGWPLPDLSEAAQ
jgi:hypothetical protein